MDDERMDRDELERRLDAQERARELVARAAVPAPDHLRARIEEMAVARAPRRPRRRALAAGVAVAAMALAALFALVLPGGAGGPALAEAAGLADRVATAPAPSARPDAPALLAAEVEGVAFPDWATDFGWTATGTRSDEIGGRPAVTVFYEREGRRLAYTIVAGDALDAPGDPVVTVDGVEFRVVETSAGESVTWERRGRTCVITAPGTSRDAVIELAAWKGGGAVDF